MKYMAPENKWQRQKKLPARNEENGTSRLLRTAPPKNQVAEKNCVRSEAAVKAMLTQLSPSAKASLDDA